MSTGEGSFVARQGDGPRIEQLPERKCAVRRHPGDERNVDDTRRPMYQFMIMNELVAGPSTLRFTPDGIDVLIGCASGFDGNDEASVAVLPGGPYAVMDYEGPFEGLAQAREQLAAWAVAEGHQATGAMLQVHMMDALDDGVVEQQFQLPVA